MKIVYYSPHPQLRLNSQSGPGTHMRETINALKGMGHEVFPLIVGDELHGASSNTDVTLKSSKLKSLVKRFVPKIIWRSLKDWQLLRTDIFAEKLLAKRVDELKPDLIYERGAYLQLSGVRVVKEKGGRHFMELNAPFLEEVREFEQARTLWFRRAKRTEKLQVQAPDLVYVVSSALKRYYSSHTSNTEKIKVVPNSVNPEYLKVNRNLKESIVNDLHLEKKRVIGFVGSIFPYHGVDILIRAFSAIAGEFPDITLLIVGDGSILESLKNLSRELKMQSRVLFTGSRPHHEVFTWIDIMDICVMAKSNWYGSPVKIFEYGAMGKAIIAPDTVPVNDVMNNNVDGILIKPSDAALRQALKILLTDDTLKEKLANNFKNKVLGEYTWKKTAETIIKDYEILKPKN